MRIAAASGIAGLLGTLLDSSFLNTTDPWQTPLAETEPVGKRFLLIADVHAGNIDNGPRQACSKSIHTLQHVVDHLRGQYFDGLFQMGDLVQDQINENQNMLNYETCLQILKQLQIPSKHLLGNHDLWAISQQNLSTIYDRNNLNSFYGMQQFTDFQVAWLGLTAEKNIHGSLPEEQIEWLKRNIYKDTPTFIFSHYGFIQHEADGSPYFASDPRMTALANGETAWKSLKGLPIKAVISAHLHMGAQMKIDNTHMITIPAFVENIASSDTTQNPGVYSILDIKSPKDFSIKSFYGSNCIMRMQVRE